MSAAIPDLVALVPSWELALRAERKSAQTIKTYGVAVRMFLKWCADNDEDQVLERRRLARWVDSLLDAGNAAATARARQLGVRRFSAWLAEEDELDIDPLLGVKAPKLDRTVIDPLSETQLKALLKACAGPDMRDRRDEAILRLMLETGVRAGEVVSLQLPDVDLMAGTAIVRRGKGGKGRVIPFGPHTARAVDRYLRLRRTHRLAERADVWLGDRGKKFSYDALHKSLGMRADRAGIDGFHPHRMRHTAAHRWLAAGGSEGGLMAVAGWTRPDMLMRYTQAQASARAADEARGLNLGDV